MKLCLTNDTGETPTQLEQAVNQSLIQIQNDLTNPETPTDPNQDTNSKPEPTTNDSKQQPIEPITKKESQNPTEQVSLNTKRLHILKTDKDTKDLRANNLRTALDSYTTLLEEKLKELTETETIAENQKSKETKNDLLTEFRQTLKTKGINIPILTDINNQPSWLSKNPTNPSDLKDIKKATKNIPRELKNSETTLYICWIALIVNYIQKNLTNAQSKDITEIITSCKTKIDKLKPSRFGHPSTISQPNVKTAAKNVLAALSEYYKKYTENLKKLTDNS